MKRLVYAIAALACLTAAPVLITAADAQVSIGVGRDGPTVRFGPDDRAMDRGRHSGSRNWDDCREVTVKKRLPDGSMSVHTTRRCD
jgi:hypothetical protein